ncbi:hypothetical protein KCP91_12220 [Microvirga sp. SRT01]|uniref:Uncharacterized protein n=1 Tax=Sphingomonas longa TaxID=2778730 RepID=A0ABS2DAV3_9SPHN|nr:MULTISPECIES: hypothetical protein [Alphaproteobacteria]MBM6577139.1 hypothetical protein [Sphingomonas sp. BT552]MBR7710183.1 hypothetical protein [Microvirga sp. SRT01]
MALKDLFGKFFDNTLAETFSSKPHDPTKARQPLLRGIDVAKRQFEAGQVKGPNRWWSSRNKVVAFTPKLEGRPFLINGVGTNHMPEERFVEFLNEMRSHVDAGDFDAVIASHGKGNTDVHIGKARGTGSRGPQASKLDARADGLPHRVPIEGDHATTPPHESYVANKAGSYWRSPEQVIADSAKSQKRKASMTGVA